MKPGDPTEPAGELREALERDFGSAEKFAAHFVAASQAVEGSGWGLVVHEPMDARLLIPQVENHQSLTIRGATPLMVCDVREHAYCLQYADDRGAYLDAFCKMIDWPAVARRYEACVR